MNIITAFETILVLDLYILCNNEDYQVQAKQKIIGESFGGIYENELDVQTNDKVVSMEYDTRPAEFDIRDNMAIANENYVSLDYETIMNGLLESRQDNIVKTKEAELKRKRKNKKYDPNVPRQMESNRRVNSLAASKRRSNVVETEENVVSIEYDKKVPKPVEFRSRNNIPKTNDIVVSSEFDTKSNELTESRRDNIAETSENRDTKVPKSIKCRKGKIQQHDKSTTRKPRKNIIKSAEWVKRRKLFDIVVHIKA